MLQSRIHITSSYLLNYNTTVSNIKAFSKLVVWVDIDFLLVHHSNTHTFRPDSPVIFNRSNKASPSGWPGTVPTYNPSLTSSTFDGCACKYWSYFGRSWRKVFLTYSSNSASFVKVIHKIPPSSIDITRHDETLLFFKPRNRNISNIRKSKWITRCECGSRL